MSAQTYVPDLESFDDGFPEELPVPPLLRSFAAWSATQPRSSLGWFHLASERLNALYVRDDQAAERLRAYLGVFMLLPEGSRLALWRRPEGVPAVVLLRATGAVSCVAPELESFLQALSKGRTGVTELDRSAADGGKARAALAEFLQDRSVKLRASDAENPNFAGWWRAFVERAKAEPDPKAESSSAVRSARNISPQWASVLPSDLLERVDLLLGLSIEDERVESFFAELGVDLRAIRDPNDLRAITREREGVSFEIAWPWDYASQWLASEYPRPSRRALEARRARMFWGMTLYVLPETVQTPAGPRHFDPYSGALPNSMTRDSTPQELEVTLGASAADREPRARARGDGRVGLAFARAALRGLGGHARDPQHALLHAGAAPRRARVHLLHGVRKPPSAGGSGALEASVVRGRCLVRAARLRRRATIERSASVCNFDRTGARIRYAVYL